MGKPLFVFLPSLFKYPRVILPADVQGEAPDPFKPFYFCGNKVQFGAGFAGQHLTKLGNGNAEL